MGELSGGQAIVRSLIEHGVDTVFGIPGIQLDNLYDAFYEGRNRIRLIHTRHEQGAAFMAMGYAQSSDKTGVYAVVPGPGLLNSLAALSTAASANLPVLALTGQIPSYQIGAGLGIPHELKDQLAVARGVIDWAERADHPAEIPDLMADAFRTMRSGRRQPALLEAAPDVLGLRSPVCAVARRGLVEPPAPRPGALAHAAELLATARRPLIVVGGGVVGAERELRELARCLDAPVVMGPNARGTLPDDAPLAYDALSGQMLWQRADLALAIGTRALSPLLAWGREGELPVVRIDVDPVQITKPRPATVAIVGASATVMRTLRQRLGGERPAREPAASWAAPVRTETRRNLDDLEPLSGFSRAVRAALPRDGILVCDVTRFAVFARFGFPVYEPRSFHLPGFQATLGWAYPAALGAKIANPHKQVVAVCGDGGFMFTAQELASAKLHGIAVVAVVFDNRSYGNVRTVQADHYGGRHIAVDLENPDFVALAQSFGIAGRRAQTPAQLQAALNELLAADAPGLVHVPVGELPNVWSLVQRPPSQGAAPR